MVIVIGLGGGVSSHDWVINQGFKEMAAVNRSSGLVLFISTGGRDYSFLQQVIGQQLLS